MTISKHLLCCDWGTSSFRLRLVNTSDCDVIAEHQSGEGVASTFKSWQGQDSQNRFDFFASKLKQAIKDLSESSAKSILNIPIIVSGMASSSIGMEEIPYATLPFELSGRGVSSRTFQDFNGHGSPLILVSGVRSNNDVMRGEEVQLIGMFNIQESSSMHRDDSLFVFPGTHSKHMRVQGGDITGFRTFMTGEIFNLLSEYSILKDSISHGGDLTIPDNRFAFTSGVQASSSNLLNGLFTVRTNQLFAKFSKDQNAFYLSGLLIGTELRHLTYESFGHLIICSGEHLYAHYKCAAEALSMTENVTFIKPELIDKATIAGQVQIFKAVNNFYE